MVDERDLKTYQLGGVAEGIDTLADEIVVFRNFSWNYLAVSELISIFGNVNRILTIKSTSLWNYKRSSK